MEAIRAVYANSEGGERRDRPGANLHAGSSSAVTDVHGARNTQLKEV